MTNVKLYPGSRLNPISRGLLGHFVEIFPGNLQGGMYDPQSPLSDEDGFRTDVIEAMKELGVSCIRWGGNQSSNYHWMDGVGSRENRPKRFDYAWHGMYDNQFGTVEFIQLCRKVGAEPVIGINMGSGTAEEAMNWVEYCNGTTDTYYANLRRSHGYEEPFNVKYWCLGNEMYGPWQFGSLNAEDYAMKGLHCACGMLSVDPKIKLVALGLESDPDWNMTVAKILGVEKTHVIPGDYIRAISLHYYPLGREEAFDGADHETRLAIPQFLHEKTQMMRSAIEIGTNDPQSPIEISWDEWSTVVHSHSMTVEDMLLATSAFHSFVRDSKYVTMANFTFFVNTGRGPLQTCPEGIVRHTGHHAFVLYNQLLGDTLIRMEDDAETVEVQMPLDTKWLQHSPRNKTTKLTRRVPWVDMVATLDSKTGDVVLFATNRKLDEDVTISVNLMECAGAYTKAEVSTIWDEDPQAVNSWEQPDRVGVTTESVAGCDQFTLTLKKHSFNAIRFTK